MAFLRYRWGRVSALLLVCALAKCAVHAEERAPAPALKDMKPTAAQGCALMIESQVGGKNVSDTRHARLVALYVPTGSPPTPFLPAGPFKARFDTDLAMRLRDDVTFSVIGSGTVKVSVNGATVVEGEMNANAPLTGKTVSLKKGKNRIVLEYASPPAVDSFVRLYWASSDFLPEPVPPGVLSYDAASIDVREGMRVREGRTLFATLHCGKCHADDVASGQAERMPELAADAPSLAEVGGRLNEGWLAHWISDPRAMRHNATMPRIFHAAEGNVAAEAKDIAAYLATVGKAEHPKDEEPAAEAVEAGGRMFAHLRCIACHTLPDHADEESVKGRTPLHYVKAKYRPGALMDFLKAPEKRYAWIRMPNFRLSDEEAQSLAAFLLSREQKEIEPERAKGDSARGKELVTSAGCLNCH